MEFAYIVEDLEGKVEILLVGNHQYKTFWVEVLRPWFDWGVATSNVGFEKFGFEVDDKSCGDNGEWVDWVDK